MIITKDCIACGACAEECPVGAITSGDIYSINDEICTKCNACIDVCPANAIFPNFI